MLLTHFGIINPLCIYLFILLSAENLGHVNGPRGPAVKHREEKNVASVSWIRYHVSETTAEKSDCSFLPALALFFVWTVFVWDWSIFFSGIPLLGHYALSSPKQAFNKKLDLTWNYR